MLAFDTLVGTQVIVLQDFGMQLLPKYEQITSVKTVYLFDYNFWRSKIQKLQLAPSNSAPQVTECRCRAKFSSCIDQNFDTFLSLKYEKVAVLST